MFSLKLNPSWRGVLKNRFKVRITREKNTSIENNPDIIPVITWQNLLENKQNILDYTRDLQKEGKQIVYRFVNLVNQHDY